MGILDPFLGAFARSLRGPPEQEKRAEKSHCRHHRGEGHGSWAFRPIFSKWSLILGASLEVSGLSHLRAFGLTPTVRGHLQIWDSALVTPM